MFWIQAYDKSSTSPLAGVLEISTEDGVLSGDAAKDLKIDLDQSLDEEIVRTRPAPQVGAIFR